MLGGTGGWLLYGEPGFPVLWGWRCFPVCFVCFLCFAEWCFFPLIFNFLELYNLCCVLVDIMYNKSPLMPIPQARKFDSSDSCKQEIIISPKPAVSFWRQEIIIQKKKTIVWNLECWKLSQRLKKLTDIYCIQKFLIQLHWYFKLVYSVVTSLLFCIACLFAYLHYFDFLGSGITVIM